MATGYEYKVIELRESSLGGKMFSDRLETILKEYDGLGWQLKTMTAVAVKERIGPGSVGVVLVTFERPRD